VSGRVLGVPFIALSWFPTTQSHLNFMNFRKTYMSCVLCVFDTIQCNQNGNLYKTKPHVSQKCEVRKLEHYRMCYSEPGSSQFVPKWVHEPRLQSQLKLALCRCK